MITRGIITYSDSDKSKVYLPILDGYREPDLLVFGGYQGTEVSSILAIPGVEVNYKIGDVVLIGFEDNDASSPIILGYLKSGINEDTNKISLTVQDLDVKGRSNLSSLTDLVYSTIKVASQ